jgi:hypothetical protein
MGNDGGSIQKRAEMVKVKQKDAVIDDSEMIKTLWTCCYLSKEPLQRPVVSCGLGRLYNKDAVVKRLLNKDAPVIPEVEHIRSLKSVFEVKLTASSVPGSPYFACPLTGREMNGKSRFLVVKGCGCIFAEQALRELPANGKCLLCEREGAMETLPLYGKAEEIDVLRKLLKPAKKRPVAEAKPLEESKAKALLEEVQSNTPIQTLKKTKTLESIYK